MRIAIGLSTKLRFGGGREMARVACLVVLVLTVSCQPELPPLLTPRTGAEWAAACARVHDPQGRWPLFAAEIREASFFQDGAFGWDQAIYIDRGADTFRREIIVGQYLLRQTVGPTGVCRASWPNPTPSPSERERFGLVGDPCPQVVRQRQLLEFLVGLPMSALGERTRFRDSVKSEVIFGTATEVVTLSFEDDPNGQIWQLYIEPVSKELVAVRFDYLDGTGELFDYRDYETFSTFRLATKRIVYSVPAEAFVIEQRLSFDLVP